MWGRPHTLLPGPTGVYSDADALANAGVPPPDLNTTFDQLVETVRRVYQPGALWGLPGTGANPGDPWVVHSLRARGTDAGAADGKTPQRANPWSLAALRWYHGLVFKPLVAPPVPLQSATLEQRQAALLQRGSWKKRIPLRVTDAFRVANTLMPTGPRGQRGSIGVTDFVAIAKASPSPRVAEPWALTQRLTDKETGIRLVAGSTTSASGTSGGRKDVIHSGRPLTNPLHTVRIEAAEDAPPPKVPWNLAGEAPQTALNEGLDAVVRGEVALMQSTLAELDRRPQVVLDKPRPGRSRRSPGLRRGGAGAVSALGSGAA